MYTTAGTTLKQIPAWLSVCYVVPHGHGAWPIQNAHQRGTQAIGSTQNRCTRRCAGLAIRSVTTPMLRVTNNR